MLLEPVLAAALLTFAGVLLVLYGTLRGQRLAQTAQQEQHAVSAGDLESRVSGLVTERMAEHREQLADQLAQGHALANSALALIEPLRAQLGTVQAAQVALGTEVESNRALLAVQRGQLVALGKEHAQCLRLLGEREAAETELRIELTAIQAKLGSAGALLAE